MRLDDRNQYYHVQLSRTCLRAWLLVTRAKKVNKLYLPLHSTPKAHTYMLGTHSRPFTHVQHCRAHARAADVLSRNTTTGFGRTRYNGICLCCVCKLHALRCAAPECNAIAAHALHLRERPPARPRPSVMGQRLPRHGTQTAQFVKRESINRHCRWRRDSSLHHLPLFPLSFSARFGVSRPHGPLHRISDKDP